VPLRSFRRQRVRWIGPLDGFLVIMTVLSIGGIFMVSRINAATYAKPVRTLIKAESKRYPLEEPQWSSSVDVPFGTVDLPGEEHTFTVRVPRGEKVKAVAVGGHRRGVAVAEIRYEPDSGRIAQLAGLANLGGQLYTELGLRGDRVTLLRSSDDKAFEGKLNDDSFGVIENLFIGDRDVIDNKTVVRFEVITQGDRKVLVVSTWPKGSADPVTDRVVKSVDIG
jgi:hypothetical protein